MPVSMFKLVVKNTSDFVGILLLSGDKFFSSWAQEGAAIRARDGKVPLNAMMGMQKINLERFSSFRSISTETTNASLSTPEVSEATRFGNLGLCFFVLMWLVLIKL